MQNLNIKMQNDKSQPKVDLSPAEDPLRHSFLPRLVGEAGSEASLARLGRRAEKYKKTLLFIFLIVAFTPLFAQAQLSSQNFQIDAPVIGPGSALTATSTNFSVDFALGTILQLSAPATSSAPQTSIVVSGSGGGSVAAVAISTEAAQRDITSVNVPLTVVPTQSGLLTQSLSRDKIVLVDIPKGSVSLETTFLVSEEIITEPEVPVRVTAVEGTVLIANAVFRVTATDANGNPVTNFAEFLTITFIIPDLPADTSNMGLYFLDAEAELWRLMPEARFVDDRVIFLVNHLTRFAIFQVPAPPLPLTLPVALKAIEEIFGRFLTPIPVAGEITEGPSVLFDIIVEPSRLAERGIGILIIWLGIGASIFAAILVVSIRVRRMIIKNKIDKLSK